jgi:hypothetical protein
MIAIPIILALIVVLAVFFIAINNRLDSKIEKKEREDKLNKGL